MIIGGNLRLLPLTGVTLPFVSYGGSSLLTSFLSLLFLVLISNQPSGKPLRQYRTAPYLRMGIFLTAGLAAVALVAGWWGVYRGPDLLTRTDNARRSIADRYVRRGSLLDRSNRELVRQRGSWKALTEGALPRSGSDPRLYASCLWAVRLEASLDPYLRGTQGNPGLRIWWDHLLYGQPPPGLDIRLSLHLDLQQKADALLGSHAGGLVLLDARSGEILAMASHPTFDPNRLDENWTELVADPQAPLFNRVTQGLYPSGAILGPLLFAQTVEQGLSPALPGQLDFPATNPTWECSSWLFSQANLLIGARLLQWAARELRGEWGNCWASGTRHPV